MLRTVSSSSRSTSGSSTSTESFTKFPSTGSQSLAYGRLTLPVGSVGTDRPCPGPGAVGRRPRWGTHPPGSHAAAVASLASTGATAPGRSAGPDKGRVPRWRSYEGYCVKCREKREFDGQEVELANGRRAAQGHARSCGTKMNRILGKKADRLDRRAPSPVT